MIRKIYEKGLDFLRAADSIIRQTDKAGGIISLSPFAVHYHDPCVVPAGIHSAGCGAFFFA